MKSENSIPEWALRIVFWFVPVVAVACLVQSVAAQDHEAVKPVPRNGSWMKRHELLNERVKQGNVDLIFIGDSITHGWENVGQEIWAKTYGARNAVNLGIAGDRTQHVLWRLEHGNIDGIKPKLAVIMIGTNNSGTNSSEQIADGISAIVKKVRDKLPETKILLLAIFPRGSDENNAKRKANAATNAMIAKLADGNQIEYLDIGAKFLDDKGKLNRDMMPDLRHVSAAAYQIWADSIEEHVARHLGETKQSR